MSKVRPFALVRFINVIAPWGLAAALIGACSGDPSSPLTVEIRPLGTEPARRAVELTRTPVLPKAGANDELSTALQDYLNEDMQGLGIRAAEAITGMFSDGDGNFYVLAESQYRGGALPILVRVDKNERIEALIFLERNEAYAETEYLVVEEYLGIEFDPQSGEFIDAGSILRKMRIGTFEILVQERWNELNSPLDRHVEPMDDLLDSQMLARLSADVALRQRSSVETVEDYRALEQPHSLVIDIPENLASGLNIIRPYDHQFITYKGMANRLIDLMGVGEYPELVEQYRTFYDGEWGFAPYFERAPSDIRGLGSEPWFGSSWHEIGFFYGFADQHPGYIVIQIEPGSDLDPVADPEAFISLRLARPYMGGVRDEHYAHLGLRAINQYGRLIDRFADRQGGTDATFEEWTFDQIIDTFDLLRGTIITTSNGQAASLGEYTPQYIFIMVNEFPPEDEQQAAGYTLVSQVW